MNKYEIAHVPELPILDAVLPKLENKYIINMMHNIIVEMFLKNDQIWLMVTSLSTIFILLNKILLLINLTVLRKSITPSQFLSCEKWQISLGRYIIIKTGLKIIK